MASNAVCWFEIYVQDLERARKFYEAVFEVKLEALESPGIAMLSFPMEPNQAGCGGALVKMDGVPSGGNSTIVYFTSKDCAIEEARVEAAGGRVHKSKMSIGQYGAISLVNDTEGNLIGIHSM